jgi:hypothetical protein
MTPDELALYQQCTGRAAPPTTEPSEAFTICGRRSGKSFISAVTAVYLGCFRSYRQYLTAGEKAIVLILARDRDQSRVVFGYIQGVINSIPALRQMVVSERVDEIELENGVVLAVKTSDYRSIRGITIVVCIADEIAFWSEQGVSPDHEILTAIRPAMATIPDSKLLVISTPYAQSGVLYEQHRDYYGMDDDHTLVWVAPTATMNPTISEALIQRELERDPDAASSEWLATFRSDLSAAFSPEALEACTVTGRDELPASPLIQYQAFVDPSGGKVDSFTVGIGHKENGKAIVDLVKAWHPPFDPGVVTGEMAEVLKGYGVLSVTGDNYGGEWPVASFRSHGIAYERCEKSKSELYLTFVPVTNSGGVELLDDKKLFNELRRLERRRGRLGKDSVDHPPRLHDDLANAVAGVSYLIINSELRLRFDQERLREMLLQVSDPPFHGFLREANNILHVRPEADPKGPVRMWEEPRLGPSYVIGAHEGEGGEKSAYVLDRSLDVCVEWHGRCDSDLFAKEVVKLGKTYNDARIGCVDDDCTTYQALLRLGYPKLYRHDNSIPKVNWIASAVDGLDGLIREGVNWPSRELLEELLSVVCRDDGKVDLRGKGRVAALAVAVKVKHDSSLESIYPSLRRKSSSNEEEKQHTGSVKGLAAGPETNRV